MTRSAIGTWQDNQVRAVFNCTDGTPACAGKLLLEYYTDACTVNALIDLGDISALAESVEATGAYHRDLGEAYRAPDRFRTAKAFLKHAKDYDADFLYLFDTEKAAWLYADIGRGDKQFSPLTPVETGGLNTMEPYHKLYFTQLTLSGFKIFEKPITFQFGKVTLISGGSSKGKSAIGEAIAYAVTGYPVTGGRNLDDLCNEKSPAIDIRLSFVADGAEHYLTRQRKDDLTDITLDGGKVTQKQLDFLFGGCKLFLSMFLPGYFIETLGTKGQNLMKQQLPPIPQEAVLASLSPYSRKLLEGLELLSPETCADRLKREIMNQEEKRAELLARKEDTLQKRREQAARQKELSALLENLTAERADCLKKVKENRVSLQANYTLLLDQLVMLQSYTSGLAPEKDFSEVIREIEDFIQELEAETYQCEHSQEIKELAEKLEQAGKLKEYYTMLSKQLQPGWICPTCFAPVTAENLAETKAKFAAAGEKLKPAILQLQQQLSLTGADETAKKEAFDKKKEADLRKLLGTLENAKRQQTEMLEAYHRELEELNILRELWQDGLYDAYRELCRGGLSTEEYEQYTRLTKILKSASEEAKALQTAYACDPVPQIDKDVEEAAKYISGLKEQLDAVLDFAAAEAALQFKHLKTDSVSISLMKVVKSTGEVKPAFDFLYLGRNYTKLSHSEQYFAGLEVAELLRGLSGREYPVFLDHVESYETVGSASGQVMLVRLAKGAPITVTPAVPFEVLPRELPKAG